MPAARVATNPLRFACLTVWQPGGGQHRYVAQTIKPQTNGTMRLFKKLAHPTGFEPVTSAFGVGSARYF